MPHPCQLAGHLRFGREIAAAKLGRIDAKIERRQVEQPLAEEAGLEAAAGACVSPRSS
jgi:hypothetical protein